MRIDIGTVLNKFDDTYDEGSKEVKTYTIKFITKDGRKREMLCRKSVKSPKQGKSGQLTERGKGKYNLKYHGGILLYDEQLQSYRTVKVAHIFGFKDHKSKQWLDVFH